MILEKRVPNKISLRFLKNVFSLEFFSGGEALDL